MTARHHHYLSQCYLKGFTSGESKKSKLIVFDLEERKHFQTIPRNVGGIRDFNRIDVEGVDPNILEKFLSKFEGEAASALHKLRNGDKFEGKVKAAVLNLLALLAVRSPQTREYLRKFHAQIAEKMMDLTLASEERWESQVRQMKESGVEVGDNATYEDIKKFHESKEYAIEVGREHHIRIEFARLEGIVPMLDARKWLIVRASSKSGPLITADRPVSLTWKEPDKIHAFYRNSPGYGMKNTQIYFPLSQGAALIGEFDGREGVIDGTKELVATLNSRMLTFAHRQVYAPKLNFYFRSTVGETLEGKHLLRHVVV